MMHGPAYVKTVISCFGTDRSRGTWCMFLQCKERRWQASNGKMYYSWLKMFTFSKSTSSRHQLWPRCSHRSQLQEWGKKDSEKNQSKSSYKWKRNYNLTDTLRGSQESPSIFALCLSFSEKTSRTPFWKFRLLLLHVKVQRANLMLPLVEFRGLPLGRDRLQKIVKTRCMCHVSL